MAGELLYEVKGTVHDEVQVIQRHQVRYMRFGNRGGWQGAYNLNRPDRLLFAYQRAFATLVAAIPDANKFLSFGVGTGTALRTVQQLYPACELFGVELDEVVIDVAVRFFNCPSHRETNFWVGDGLTFLEKVPIQYDLIFIDAYLKTSVYTPVLDPDIFAMLDARLDNAGVVAFNLISVLPMRGHMLRFLQAAKNYFPFVYVLPVGLPFTAQNILLVLSKRQDLKDRWVQQCKTSGLIHRLEHITYPFRLRKV